MNNESADTYWFGWIITKLGDSVDIANDTTKRYMNTDLRLVHMDNNIITPNFYYNITFYVKGNDSYYNGMINSMFTIIYIGIPPKGGKCSMIPSNGIATVTTFQLSTLEWKEDPNDYIVLYNFYYSLDGGKTFIPVP
jgi:hypothetical protein